MRLLLMMIYNRQKPQYKSLAHTFRGHTDWVKSVDFSPDGIHFISGSADRTIKLWNKNTGLIKTFTGHNDAVMSVSFSPNGKYFISGSKDRTIKLWAPNEEVYRTQIIKERRRRRSNSKQSINLPRDLFDRITEFL